MAGAGASEGFEAFPLTLVLAFCREAVRERVRPSSLCICGSYATGKLKLGMVHGSCYHWALGSSCLSATGVFRSDVGVANLR